MGLLDAFSNPYGSSVKQAKKGRKGFQQTMEQTTPFYQGYMDTANQGRGVLSDMLGLTGNYDDTVANFRNDPGYQFRFNEGMKGLDQSAAASGSLNSGAHQKALMGYGQGMADQSWQQKINNLGGLQQGGFAGAQGLTNDSKTLADLRMQQGQAQDMNSQGAFQNTMGAIGMAGSFLTGMPSMGGGGMGSMFGGGSAPRMPTYSNGAVNPWAIY